MDVGKKNAPNAPTKSGWAYPTPQVLSRVLFVPMCGQYTPNIVMMLPGSKDLESCRKRNR